MFRDAEIRAEVLQIHQGAFDGMLGEAFIERGEDGLLVGGDALYHAFVFDHFPNEAINAACVVGGDLADQRLVQKRRCAGGWGFCGIVVEAFFFADACAQKFFAAGTGEKRLPIDGTDWVRFDCMCRYFLPPAWRSFQSSRKLFFGGCGKSRTCVQPFAGPGSFVTQPSFALKRWRMAKRCIFWPRT